MVKSRNYKYQKVIILMGAPGSGKTSIGRLVYSMSDADQTVFVSTGEYLRNDLGLVPPFTGLDYRMIFSKICQDKLVHGKNLIIDCNPYPPAIWMGVCDLLGDFEKVFIFHIKSKRENLRKRLLKRDRKDNPEFTDDERLQYYFNMVEPEINKLYENYEVNVLQNDKDSDLLDCSSYIIKKIYNEQS